jgi:GAF domain-containing protein
MTRAAGSENDDERPGPVGLDAVLTTEVLTQRPARPADYESESRALSALAHELAANPRNLLRTLVETIRELCNADSAGISILVADRTGGGSGTFRWEAVAGQFAHNVGGGMPRDHSPCGTVIDQNRVLLFSYPARHFRGLRNVEPRIFEALLAPFHVDGTPVGTVWAIGHSASKRFDGEDARLLLSVSRFAAAGYQLATAFDAATTSQDALRQRVENRTRDLERANAALLTSEQRFRQALEIPTVGVVFFDAQGVITAANEAFFAHGELQPRRVGTSRTALGSAHPTRMGAGHCARHARAQTVGGVYPV